MEPGSRISVQRVLEKAVAEDPENVEVWKLDASHGEAALCRVFVRRGLCKYGARCRHRHDVDLSTAALRAQRGAAMPNLVKSQCRPVFACGENVAFVLSEGRAVFDYEDPLVARRFLSTSPECLQGRDLWAALPAEVAVATLASAGLAGAGAALRACKDWNEEPISQGLREHTFKDITGAEFRGCSAQQLGEMMFARRLLISTYLQCTSSRPADNCSPVVQTLQPSPVGVLLVDGSVVFAVLRSGEVRCHRSSTGQLLASSPSRLGKGRFATAAALLGSEAFVLGDDCGGLLWIRRDDLSETQSLRISAAAPAVALAPLQSAEDCVCLCADGSLEMIHVSETDVTETPVSVRIAKLGCIGALSMTPALCVSHEDVAVVVGHNEVWTVAASCLTGPTTTGPAPEAAEGLCHGICVEGQLVTASSASSQLRWWAMNGVHLKPEAETCLRCEGPGCGGVLALAHTGDLCASLHALLTVVLWQATLRQQVLQVSLPGLGHTLALARDVVAVASGPAGLARRAAANALHLATLPLVVESVVKEPKKPKPAKMFAHKNRGGRKNQKGKHARQT